MIHIKDGVQFKYSIGGLAILNALKSVSKMIDHDLTITSGCDGIHHGVGPLGDPHYVGDAYDVRSHDLDPTTKQQVLANLNNLLGPTKFYYFLENPNSELEHFHIQVNNKYEYGINDFLTS